MIRLTRHKENPVQVEDEALMFRLIRASFNQRRKTLVNGLCNSPEVEAGKEEILAALEQMGMSPTVRGETFGLEEFAKLANLLCKKK